MINFELDFPLVMILLSSLMRFDYTMFISLSPERMSRHIIYVAFLSCISNVFCFRIIFMRPFFIGDDFFGSASYCLNWNSLLNGGTILSAFGM